MIYTPIAGQWRKYVIEPTLARMGSKYNSEVMINLLLGTVATESKFQYIAQYPKGPALGYYQIEPETARDVLKRYYPEQGGAYAPGALERALVWELDLQTEIARLKYWDASAPLPLDPENVGNLAQYWLEHYNASGVLGKVRLFVDSWYNLVQA